MNQTENQKKKMDESSPPSSEIPYVFTSQFLQSSVAFFFVLLIAFDV